MRHFWFPGVKQFVNNGLAMATARLCKLSHNTWCRGERSGAPSRVPHFLKTMMIETSPVLRLPPAQAYPCPCCSRIVKQDHRLPEEILSQQPRTRTPYYQERPYKQYPRQAAPDRVPSLYNAAPERRAHICCPAPALSTSFVVSVSTVT
ncbi:uncharacterized protein LOC126371276 [Pectinophora gossypiella]|uniref:uncharacterized protein LOC126371276 n=1 Tax=Pectinophora gossypiella TaxID=13191 RepID=UPI00214E61E5|nr:uncharacterized protein LOC126371276 [Pectinophora gossypiella]